MKKIVSSFTFVFLIIFSWESYGQNIIVMTDGGNDSDCSAIFYDPGEEGDYPPPTGTTETITHTICNPTPGESIWVVFSAFNLFTNDPCPWGSSIDKLVIYDGPDDNSTLIGTYTGTMIQPNTGSATIEGSSGCLTFQFIRENNGGIGCSQNNGALGWKATTTCTQPPLPETGENCFESLPFCSDDDFSDFPNTTNTAVIQGPDYGCLDDPNSSLTGMQNPQWFYFKISEDGELIMDVSQTNTSGTGIDLDFVMWGPFTSLTAGCAQVMSGNEPPIQCSSDPDDSETIALGALGGGNYWYNQGLQSIDGTSTPPEGQEDEIYIVVLTNANGQQGTINLDQTGGDGATDCSLVVPCDISEVTATPSPCDEDDNTFSVTGEITFDDAPESGYLIAITCEEDSVILSPPFVSPMTYTIDEINSNGEPCEVTAYFTAEPVCKSTSDGYTNPEKCHCELPEVTITDLMLCNGETGNLNDAISNPSYSVLISYHATEADAIAGVNDIGNLVSVAGTYYLRAVDPDLLTCFDTFEIEVSIATISLNATTTDDICGTGDGVIEITATGGGSPYQYSIDNGATFQNSNEFNNLLAGNYAITVQDANGCEATSTATVNTPDLLSFSVEAVNPTCASGVGSITIIGLDGNTDYTIDYFLNGSQGPSGNYTSNGGGNITLPGLTEGTYTQISVTELSGCTTASDTTLVLIQPAPPIVTAPNDTTICLGESITLTADNPNNATLLWSDNIIDGETFTPAIGVHTYTVTAQVDNCVETDQVTVTVEDFPSADFSAETREGCAPLSIQFINTTNTSTGSECVWEFGDGATAVGCSSIIHTYFSGGSYTVSLTVESAVGCKNTATKSDYIKVIPKAVADFTADPGVTNISHTEVNFINHSQFADSFIWDFGDTSALSTTQNPTHLYPEGIPKDYIVTLVASNEGGCNDTLRGVVKVEDEIIYYIPNTFTPDGNHFNDVFMPVFTSGVEADDFHFTIFNRWGEILFESFNPDFGWDGTYGEKIVPDGTYVWKLEFRETMSDKRHTELGDVNVIR